MKTEPIRYIVVGLVVASLSRSVITVAEAQTAAQPAPAASNRVSITIEGEWRVIRANGLPDHETGRFPNRGNPNTIAPQNYMFRVPLHPQKAAAPRPIGLQPFGIATNGVVFDPGANEFWNGDRGSGWQYEALDVEGKLGMDLNNAHVQPGGVYHYHGIPTGLVDRTKDARQKMVLLGWAADGFPIYGPWAHSNPTNGQSNVREMKSSYRLKKGTRPGGPGGAYDGSFVQDFEYVAGAGDLDECNGRTGVTPEVPQGTYYYCLTTDFPFIPRMYRGTPDPSFERRGPPGGPGRRGRRGGLP